MQNIVQYCLTNKLTDKQACNPDVSAQTSFPLQVCAKFQSLDLEILNQINLTKIHIIEFRYARRKNYGIIWEFFPKCGWWTPLRVFGCPTPSLASNVYPQKFQILAGWISGWHTNSGAKNQTRPDIIRPIREFCCFRPIIRGKDGGVNRPLKLQSSLACPRIWTSACF